MVETTDSDRMPTTPETPYLHAVVAVCVVPVFFAVLAFLDSGAMGAVSGAVYAFLLASPVVGFGVLAWHRGCRVTVVPTVSFFVLFLLLSSYVSMTPGVNISASDFFFAPVLFSVFVVGAEWSVRERNDIADFLRSRTGVASVVAGVTHTIVGMSIQFRARPQVINNLLEVDLRPPLLELLGLFGMLLVFVGLFVVVFVPVFLVHTDGLLSPVGVLTGWVVSGALLNYLWWDAYPLGTHASILGLGVDRACPWSPCFVYRFPLNNAEGAGSIIPVPLPAPDYAVMVYFPLLLITLTAVFEGYVRKVRN